MDPAPPGNTASRSDQEMLDRIVRAQQAENRNRAERLALAVEFHGRCERDHQNKKDDGQQYFVLTPLQETTAEVAPLLGLSETTIEIQIDLCTKLQHWFPHVWDRCLAGRLDVGRTQCLLDAAEALADTQDIARLAALMDEYFDRYDDPATPLVTLTRAQLHRAVSYRKLRFKQKTEEENFLNAFKKRRVSFRPGDNGMGHLGVSHMVTETMAADYRLTLIAKKLCEGDETRTLEQMRADVMVDLLMGRLEVSALTSELEQEAEAREPDPLDEPGDTARRDLDDLIRRHPSGAYARPVVNVTVPIQTLMGVSEEPGVLSGGNPIPAELARIIAEDQESTWYRMLTDKARTCIELSTASYRPTKPIWRQVVARDHTCIYPGCTRPSVQVELDHREEFPEGETSTQNLEPLCKRHHRVKHADGFRVLRQGDGSYLWITRRGSRFRTSPSEQPEGSWPAPDADEVEAATPEEVWDSFLDLVGA